MGSDRGAGLDLDAIEKRCEAATPGEWEETWRPIEGHEGYEVSDFGNVRSFWLKGNNKDGRSTQPRTLALRSRADGKYPSVSLPRNGSYSSRPVHRLVAAAFHGPCPEGYEVAHLNGDAADNRAVNLQYVTHRENEQHKAVHGTNGVGERNSIARWQGWQVAEVKYLAERSVPQGKIAALFDMDRKTVSEILCGKRWEQEPARTDVPALIAEVRRLREFVQRCADRGIRADTMPTMRIGKPTEVVAWWFYSYLDRVDQSLRQSAREVLAGGSS